ncbi:MAG: hypothetical protein JWN39_711 [Ilumatobacteraceae bacterium]|nr:hypothetical protein [Ilumatobacteraceae bacterium]
MTGHNDRSDCCGGMTLIVKHSPRTDDAASHVAQVGVPVGFSAVLLAVILSASGSAGVTNAQPAPSKQTPSTTTATDDSTATIGGVVPTSAVVGQLAPVPAGVDGAGAVPIVATDAPPTPGAGVPVIADPTAVTTAATADPTSAATTGIRTGGTGGHPAPTTTAIATPDATGVPADTVAAAVDPTTAAAPVATDATTVAPDAETTTAIATNTTVASTAVVDTAVPDTTVTTTVPATATATATPPTPPTGIDPASTAAATSLASTIANAATTLDAPVEADHTSIKKFVSSTNETESTLTPTATAARAIVEPTSHVAPSSSTSNTTAVYNVDRIRYVRAMAPNREVQRLALDLDGVRISVRVDGGKSTVGIVSDPDNALGGSWVHQVERTIDQTVRAATSNAGGSGPGHSSSGNGQPQGDLANDARQRRSQAQSTWVEHSGTAFSGLRWAEVAHQLSTQSSTADDTANAAGTSLTGATLTGIEV